MRKNIYFLAVAICLSINSLWAQAPLVKGEKQLNAGLGYGLEIELWFNKVIFDAAISVLRVPGRLNTLVPPVV